MMSARYQDIVLLLLLLRVINYLLVSN